MLSSQMTREFEAKKQRNHAWSFVKVFNPYFMLSPFVGCWRSWKFEEGRIEYRDIYIFGFRIIRWQLLGK